MAAAARKDETLSFRVSAAEKATLLEAAARTGGDITSFVVQPALARAREVLEHERFTVVTVEMREHFANLISNPSPPTPSLMQRVSDRRHRVIDGQH